MRPMIACMVALLVVLGLNGCGSGRPIRYYTIQLPPPAEPSTGAYPVTLLIGRIHAPEILQDGPIAYRTGPNEIGIYNYHSWIEPPVRMVKVALIRRLRASGRYQSVAELGSVATGEFVLSGRLDDLEEVDAGNVSALVTMEFELVDRKAGGVVWTHFYSQTEPVQGKEVPEVVSALDRNLVRGLTEVVSGLDAYFANRFPPKH